MASSMWSTLPAPLNLATLLLSIITSSTGYPSPYTAHPRSAAVTETTTNPQISASFGTRSMEAQGTCPSGTTWSRILDTPQAGATCCPDDYQARSRPDQVLTNLVGIFCCPSDTPVGEYCPGRDQLSPVSPNTCPKGTHLNTFKCVGGYLAEDKSMSARISPSLVRILGATLGVLWIVLGKV